MLSTSALRSTVSVLAMAGLLLTACGGPGVYEKEMVVSGYDFTKYTDQGFLITPEKYTGAYQSIATLSVTVWPRIELKGDTSETATPGPDDTSAEWYITDPVSTEEVIDSLYTRAQSLGADAIMNFRAETVSESLSGAKKRTGVRREGSQLTGRSKYLSRSHSLSAPMPGLDYPLVFECSNCMSETTVDQSHAQDLHPNPSSFEAIHLTLENRGWMHDELDHMIWCPDCVPSGSPDTDQGTHEDTDQLDAFIGR